jgi:hypothetical protein
MAFIHIQEGTAEDLVVRPRNLGPAWRRRGR